MAKVFGNGAGQILRVLSSALDEKMFSAPVGATVTIEFDESTNASVLAGIHSAWAEHDCVGGVLRRNGAAVTLAADSAAFADRKDFKSNLATAISQLDTIIAQAPTATTAQMRTAIEQLARILKRTIRYSILLKE